MKIYHSTKYPKVIAMENIKTGDVVARKYKYRAKPASSKDTNLFGFSMGDYKKGGEVLAVIDEMEITPNNNK